MVKAFRGGRATEVAFCMIEAALAWTTVMAFRSEQALTVWDRFPYPSAKPHPSATAEKTNILREIFSITPPSFEMM
jgi:hypothetical protein